MNHFHSAPRRCLYRMLGWFFLVNALVASLIVFGYVSTLSTLQFVPGASIGSMAFGSIYFFMAFFAQICLYQFTLAIVCAVIATIFPWRFLIVGLASFLSATLLAALIGDAVAFRLYHIHYAEIGWQIYRAGAFAEVLTFGLKEQVTMCVAFGICCLLEVLLALWLWRVFSKPGYRIVRRIVFSVVLSNLIIVYLSFGLAIAGYGWSQGYRYAILRVGRFAPYLSELYLHFFERKKPVRNLAVNHEAVPVVIHDILRKLDYPKHPMVPSRGAAKMNIVMIVIDTWRFTAMNAEVTPNIYRFSQKATQFHHHMSGGNCTQPGLFSLFYGLPPNYWQAFLIQHQGPVLMQALAQSGYRLGIFLSAPISFPQFDKTIFSDVVRLTTRTAGDSSIARDEGITRKFLTFLNKQHSKKPFFSFLFYDAVHNYCEPARPKENPFLPAISSCDRFSLDEATNPIPYLNLYHNKVWFVDEQVGQVLRALERTHHAEDTLVIITADHGEEMNDDRRGVWGHASAYNAYQLHVPLLVYWPHRAPTKIDYQTTHYDVAPTLIHDVLGYENDPSDYAVGRGLWHQGRSDYYVAGSYGDYAVVMQDQIMRIYPDGDYTILSSKGDYLSQEVIKTTTLKKVLQDLSAYFRLRRH